ncbi:uncharacterized protein LOC119688193 [Teleopsis dalmanni]|uniref:uncharacterized protein LOC119688193 n=1 Tax=Teleopsis dalmanni TaxID=139649 RepID=UPI0018CF25FC|nr:uncharacterized protein LOC119688193 [Teleopsis dalmanni]
MFSCCRANPKSSSTKSAKKDKQRKSDEQETSNKTSDKKLIIPTITIENGKAIDNLTDHNSDNTDIDEAVSATATAPAPANTVANNGIGNIGDDVNVASVDNIRNSENIKIAASTETVAAADIATKKPTDSDTAIIANSEQSNKQNTSLSTSSTDGSINEGINESKIVIANTTTTSNEYTTAATGLTEVQRKIQEAEREDEQHSTQCITENVEDYDVDKKQLNDKQPMHIINTTEPTTMEQNIHDFHPKSCLSRHNSTHTSIKKKVNISTHAEIIEPDPLPPPHYDHASLGDDDDVFSDSLPPPKRESMCAPYIEPNNKIQDTVVFAHGLPEWFNDERIHDIGCIEPPVTPVGRDELELKRQRLYTDLLRAAHAAVEHSVRFTTPIAVDTFSYTSAAVESRKGAGSEGCFALLIY